MKHLVPLAACLALGAPASAQEDPIYAPCLDASRVTADFSDVQAAGWTHLTAAQRREQAAPPLAEVELAARSLPYSFLDVEEATEFAGQALATYLSTLGIHEIFTRDGQTASISADLDQPGRVTVRCVFAGMEVADVATIFASDVRASEDLAISFGSIPDPARPDGVQSLEITAIRFEGDEAVLAPLSVREAVIVTLVREVAQ